MYIDDFNYFILSAPFPEYCSGTCTNGTIRLVGGSTPYKGRVEVCVEGCWGTVCGVDFDAMDASVVCRALGLPAFGMTSVDIQLKSIIHVQCVYEILHNSFHRNCHDDVWIWIWTYMAVHS